MDVKLIVKKGSHRTPFVRLRSEETIVGRKSGCDLRIPSAEVSRRHCRLSFREGYLTVEDLESANGTYVNGVRIKNRQMIRPGDLLAIGPIVFLVQYQLSQAAIDHMLKEEALELLPVEGADGPGFFDFDAEEAEVVEPEEADLLPVPAELKTPEPESAPWPQADTGPNGEKAEAPPPKPERLKTGLAEVEEVEDAVVFEDDKPWEPPAEKDLRDLLSGLDEE
jgi:predicted component of type VI protein secretion system